MHAERPERVLVRAHDAEVLAVAVHAEHLAELARVDQLLQLLHARVVQQEVPGHEHEVAVGGECDELVHLGGTHGGRLLDEHVLAGVECALGQLVVRRDRGGDDDRVQVVVREELVELGRDASVRVPGGEGGSPFVARGRRARRAPELLEVPREVRPPVAEARDADLHAQSFQTLRALRAAPAGRVAEVDHDPWRR